MGETTQKKRKTTTVRIYEDTKQWLAEVARKRAVKERRDVTELEVGEEIFQKAKQRS